jgi:hypothetical protein
MTESRNARAAGNQEELLPILWAAENLRAA